jgi:hypothetical protein
MAHADTRPGRQKGREGSRGSTGQVRARACSAYALNCGLAAYHGRGRAWLQEPMRTQGRGM